MRHDFSAARTALLERRRRLFHEISEAERDLEALGTPDDPERDERAQEEALRRLLDRLDDRERMELLEIQRALAKIPAGRYGICERCGKAIAPRRLEALPETRYCENCARELERESAPASVEPLPPDASRDPPLPADLQGLSEGEIAEAVREELRGVDGLGAVTVEFHGSRVVLGGEVASEDLITVATQIVTDRMGLAVEDRIRVRREVGETPERETTPPLPRDEPIVRYVEDTNDEVTEDVVEAENGEGVYEPPDRPIPEPRPK